MARLQKDSRLCICLFLVFGIVNVVSFVSTVACNVKELYEFNFRRFIDCLLNMK